MHRLIISTSLLAVLSLTALLGVALSAEPNTPTDDATATVFYFHGDRRCATCRSIEQATDAVVSERFTEKLESGDLVWKVINFDKDENRHYIEDLALAGSGVVIARVSPSGEIRDPKILQDVWRLARDETRMREYLLKEITGYLGESR
jgi:hypothetical protein